MRIYICGPVSSTPNRNEPAFEDAARTLAASGYDASVPTRIVSPRAAHHDAMRTCLAELLRCDGVALLDGWERSKGCSTEVAVARACGMPQLPVYAWAAMS